MSPAGGCRGRVLIGRRGRRSETRVCCDEQSMTLHHAALCPVVSRLDHWGTLHHRGVCGHLAWPADDEASLAGTRESGLLHVSDKTYSFCPTAVKNKADKVARKVGESKYH